MSILKGHDVSKWQGTGNPPDGDFVIAKSTQGIGEIDRTYEAHRTAALRAGKAFGSYHYGDGGNASNEARYYVRHTLRTPGELMALDFESPGVLHSSDPVGWALSFLSTCHELTNARPLLYVNDDVLHRFDWRRVVAGNYGLWLADWDITSPGSPAPWPFLALWQSGDTHGKLDVDVFFGSRAAWQMYGGYAAPAVRLYIVRERDTLSSIAAALKTTVSHLVSLNRLTNPNLIYPGQRLHY